MNQRHSHSKSEDEISLKEISHKVRWSYHYIISQWKIILLVALIGAVLGYLYATLKKTKYVAETTFVLEEQGGAGGLLGQYSGLASLAGIDIGSDGGSIFHGDNILELYRSRRMIEKTLLSEIQFDGKSDLLIHRYIDFNNLREKWNKEPELAGIHFKSGKEGDFSRVQDSIIGTIVNDIKKNYLLVDKADKKLSIIKVEVKAADEIFSKGFNDQIVKNVNDFYIQTKTKKSLENIDILQQKTDSVRTLLNREIYSGASTLDATPNLNLTRQSQRIAPMQRSQIAAETNKAILSELVKNLEVSKIALTRETPLIQVVDFPIYPLEKIETGKIKGLVLGFLVGSFLIIFILLVRIFLKKMIEEE